VRKLLDTVWFLPALSALFFLLAFYPFNIGVFALLALAPLRLYAARPNATNRRTFWGAAAVGASFSLLLSYVTIFQFHWVYEARIFTLAVRASVLPIVLASGALCGAALLLGRRLFSWSPVLQAAMGAAIYALAEASLSAVFRGYYFGTLAYALADWPVFRAVASFGGTPLATAAAAFASLLIAEAIAVAPERRGRFAAQVAGFAAAVLVAAAALSASLPSPEAGDGRTVSVAVLQSPDRGDTAFARRDAAGRISNPNLEALLRAAESSGPDLIVYPFSPVAAAVRRSGETVFDHDVVSADEPELASWAAASVSSSTTLALWYTVLQESSFSNEIVFWRGGSMESRYAKRHLYPFMDYTPAWAQSVGLFSTPVDMVPGDSGQVARAADVPVGALVCSEVNDAELARETASSGVGLLVSIGSEAMFADDVAGRFNLASARFRAAETGLPVIRSSKFGPSAIVDGRGEIVAEMPFGDGGFAVAPVNVTAASGPRTVYARYGGAVPAALLALVALCRVIEAVVRRGREPRLIMYSRDAFRRWRE
jgi:apolipoprotein N-acyltransferase